MEKFTVKLELEELVEAASEDEAIARFKDNFEFADIHHGTFNVEVEPKKKKFEVIRHYTCSAVYVVEADDDEQAYKLACQGEGHRKTYEGDTDDNYEVMEILVEGA